jgi:cysteinyl-tRNA synthetase
LARPFLPPPERGRVGEGVRAVTLRLYDTMRREKVEFVPADPKRVTMYVCGPTVYDLAHVGNARPVVVFDVLYRLLRRIYGEKNVVYARNVTDIDDKIIDAAKERGEDIAALTVRTEKAFHDDMAALGALPPDVEPHATAHIAEMIAMIEKLIASGHAYAAEGHVLFSVAIMASYGRLSRHSRDELIAGARVEIAPYKKDPADFVLWKPSTPDQPGWPSPWGRGRPGWHLECSAMSEKHLGLPIDIHGGGQDLIFPHHENEIAQSVCAHEADGTAFVRHWMHNGHVMVEGEKMSKSLGNFYTVRQLLDDGWPGEVIRLVLLKTHYRAPLNFSRAALEEAKAELDGLYGALSGCKIWDTSEAMIQLSVLRALEDDLNTAEAIAQLHGLATQMHTSSPGYEHDLIAGRLVTSAKFMGLLQQDPEAWFKAGVANKDEIERLIAQREAARKAKNYAEADRIRDLLKSQGIALGDMVSGSTDWKRK